jgi:secretion/DNA translocation related CpaE-like protein
MAARVLRAAVPPPEATRPLLVTADADLLDDLVRIAGDAGATIDVAPDAPAAERWYRLAPLVLVGIDVAPALARARLPRRPGVVLVGYHGSTAPPDWHVADVMGAQHIAALPAAEPWLAKQLAILRTGISGRVVAVLGGRGGAGASVLAVGLAVTGARVGMRTLLVDGDPLGGGVDLVLGWESLDGLRWPALSQTSGRISPPALVEVLPQRGELVVLSWDRGEPVAVPPEAMAATLDAGRRGQDLVVVDLPRRFDEASVIALTAADGGLLVDPAELGACGAATRDAADAALHCPSLALVVRGPAPGGLKDRDVEQAIGLPLIGSLKPEPGLAAALERGEPPARDGKGPLARLCERLLDELDVPRREAA